MATNRNWFKRLFRLDFDDQFDAALDLIEVQEIAIVDVHSRVDGVQEAVKIVTGRVDTVEGKLAALKTFDFFGRTVVAQFDFEKSIVGDTSITVSIDNVAAQAFLRFGSAQVVDTIDAVWFISKTGVSIQNDFGDVLHPAAQRRDVQEFLYMTSEKQGDEPLDIIIPDHTHDNYISIDELNEVKKALDLKFDKSGGDLSSGGAFIGTNRLKPQGAGANTLYEGTSYSHPQALINSAMMKEYAAEVDHTHDAAEQQPPVTVSPTPPDEPAEGDLWMLDASDTDVTDKLFVRVGDVWEPTTSLQRERQHRIAADLLAVEQLSRADSHYMHRLDKIVLPAPLLADKQVTVHDGDLPDTITDDKIHFKRDLSTGDYWGYGGELAFRGDDPGAGIKYAIMHHRKNAGQTYREEWHVREVTFTNGTVRVRAREAFGDSWASFDDWSCSLWLLTEEDVAELSYVRSDGDTNFPHEADRRWTKWKSNAAKNPDGTLDTADPFGISIDLSSGNTYKNQFEVTANSGYIFKALGGSGRELWIGSALRQKGGDLDNPKPEDYVTRKNLDEGLANADIGLDLTQQDGEATGLENLTKIGTLRYDRGNFNWGADVKNNYARFNHGTPIVVGLNQYSLEDVTIAWIEVFPVGDTLIIEGAAGSMALRVLETQISGTNQRTHNFKTEVLYRTGEFVGEEVLTISTGDVATQKQLLLDGAVVGDSDYEPRITALEEHAHDEYMLTGVFPEEGFPDGPLTGYEIFDFADKMFTLVDVNQKLQDKQIALNKEAVAELTARMDALEEAMKPWLGLDIGTYATKAENYEPTGTSQTEGTAGMWWTNVSMNTTPNNHVRIGMQANPDLCTQIAAMPVPFEMDVIQPEAKQTWHVYEVYERGTGVLHVLNDVAWGDPFTHSHIAVDTQFIVRKT